MTGLRSGFAGRCRLKSISADGGVSIVRQCGSRARVTALALTGFLLLGVAPSLGDFAPTDVDGLALWLDASDDTTITETDGDVSEWRDKSGLDRHAAQSTSASQPSVEADTLNGLGTLSFDGDTYLALSGEALSMLNAKSGVTAFAVVRYDASGGRRDVFFCTTPAAGATTRVSFGSRDNNFEIAGRRLDGDSFQRVSSDASAVDTWYIQGHVLDHGSDNVDTRVDGATIDSSTFRGTGTYSATDSATMMIAQHGSSAPHFQGRVAELVMFDEAIGVSDAETIEGYLAWKWGLESQLPAEHTFADAPPGDAEYLPAAPFALADPITGSEAFTGSGTVELVGVTVPDGYTHVQLTEDGDVGSLGATWTATNELPGSYTFSPAPTPESVVAVYAWFTNTSEVVTLRRSVGEIIYTMESPSAIAHATLEVDTYAGAPVTIELAQVNDKSHGGTSTVESVEYPIGIHHLGISTNGSPSGNTLTLPPGVHTVTLTVTNNAGNAATDTCAVTVTDAGDATTTDDVTWLGDAGIYNTEWFRGQNWSGGVAPANPTPGRVIFAQDGLSDTVAKRLPPVSDWAGTTPTNVWRVGGLRITGGPHHLDLDGNTLRISTEGGTSGDLYMITPAAGDSFTGFNGTVIVERDVSLNRGTLDLTDATLHGALRDLKIAWQSDGRTAYVDLRGTVITSGTLDVRDLFVGARKTNKGYLYMDASTDIDTLWVRRTMILADSQSSEGQIGWQDPDRNNNYFLPPGLNLVFGDKAEGESGRGNLRITLNGTGGSSGAVGRLAVHDGGTFDGWLNLIDVGRSDVASGGSTARLDLRGLNSFELDAKTLRIGTTASGNTGTPNGIAWLPAGTARVDTVIMGDVALNNRATLDLTGTVLEIDEILDMRDNSLSNPTEIIVHVQGTSCGPDLGSDASLELTGPATIKLMFEAAPEPGQDHYWGLRLVGNHAAVIGALHDDGALTMTMDFAESNDYRTAVYYADGYTHAGLLDASAVLPPALVARDLTVEVSDAATTRIDASDLVLALYNPDNLTETGRTIAHPSVNSGTPAAYLDFPTTSLPVTYTDVTLTVNYEDSVTAVDTADVAFDTVAAGTTDDLTWTGQASDLTHLERREWFWGTNWSEAQPPANPTTGALTFADDDNADITPHLLAPVPDWEGTSPTNRWRIGRLRIGNTSGQHTIDLGEQVLDVSGNVLVNRLFPSGAASLTVSNGVLSVGGDLEAVLNSLKLVDLTLELSPTSTFSASPGSTVTVTNNAVIAGPFQRLLVGAVTGGTGILDMRGASFAGGELDVEDLRIAGHNGGGSYGEFRMDANTLDTIRVSRHFWMNSTGGANNNQRGWGRIGVPNPQNVWDLPPDVDIFIGSSDNARGTLQMVWNTASWLSTGVTRLGISSGGVFEAWLDSLIVGEDNGTGGKATLDLRELDTFLLDAVDVRIGAVTRDPPNAAQGEVFLPSGEATFGTLTMGRSDSAASFGRLELNDTRVTVTDAATLHASAEVTINVAAGAASGLALPGLPTVEAGATVQLVFEAPPSHSGLHYGLKVAGNVVDDLTAADWLSWDDSALSRPAEVYHVAGETYVGIPPPAGSLFLVR